MEQLDTSFWAGTEMSLHAYIQAQEKFQAADLSAAQAAYTSNQQEPEPLPRLFSKQGDVGVISIAGPLVNSDSWINEFMGRTGYPEIRDALIHAATDPSVSAIVLDVNSGGGAVSGVSDVANLIKKIDQGMKPVHTFTDGAMGSAAYWLGSSARSVTAGQVAEVGSIGVLVVHKEMSKGLEMEGIKATVIKAGEYKASGNPYEPLTDKVRGEIQGQLDHIYSIFAQAVAENRNVTYPVADQKMGQGRVFIGTQAVDVGLADAIGSFDSVISKVQGAIDLQKKSSQYGANFSKGSTMKTALTEQQLVLMAELGLPAPTAEQTPAAPAAAAVPAAETEAPAPVAATETVAPVAEPSSDLTAFLKTSLAEAQATVTDLTIQLRDVKAASEAMTTSHAALRQIAEASVDRLKVALGGAAGGAQALTDESLLAEHASLRAQFEGKFKAGGLAAVSSAAPSEKLSDSVDPVRQARISSTRLAK
jgi:signal peptide peptidase SppA